MVIGAVGADGKTNTLTSDSPYLDAFHVVCAFSGERLHRKTSSGARDVNKCPENDLCAGSKVRAAALCQRKRLFLLFNAALNLQMLAQIQVYLHPVMVTNGPVRPNRVRCEPAVKPAESDCASVQHLQQMVDLLVQTRPNDADFYHSGFSFMAEAPLVAPWNNFTRTFLSSGVSPTAARICWRSTRMETCRTTCAKTTRRWTSSRRPWPTEVTTRVFAGEKELVCFPAPGQLRPQLCGW